MSAGRKRRGGRKPARVKKRTPKADGQPAATRPETATPVSARSILDECMAATSLVEVTLHSLEQNEIGYPEQEVLKRALKVIWVVHDWIDESSPDLGDEDDDGEGEP
ncbi:MAG: hypothetical protein AB7G51_11935 [Steroidobacteraceae bacterium]